MNKKLITSAVASAVALPTAAFAAIDDQGMAYVTAAEGLHGSLRMDLLIDSNGDNVDASTQTNSLRMWVNGTADLGGGLQSTYYWEFRGNRDVEDEEERKLVGGTNVQSEAWDIGLKGAFGEVEFGKIDMVSYRLTPSASLAFERGSERSSPGADTKDGGWRYTSPVINGFQFGVSGILNGTDDIDGSLNEYALAMKYTMPIGLEVGVAYENVKNDVRNDDGTLKRAQQLHVANNTTALEDSQGYRFGMRYGQDNWLLAYEYRTYDSFVPSAFGPIAAYIDVDASATVVVPVTIRSGEKDVDYNVHAFGVQVKLDRITMSANYSTDEVELNVDNVGAGTSIQKQKFTKERDVISIDAAYALGSRTHIVLGWKQEDSPKDDVIRGSGAADDNADTPAQAAEQDDTAITYLFYRIDF